MGSSPKGDIKAKLTQSLEVKEEDIIYVFGLYTKFGGGRSTGFALVYDSLDARKQDYSKKMLRRVSWATVTPYRANGRVSREEQAGQEAEEGYQGQWSRRSGEKPRPRLSNPVARRSNDGSVAASRGRSILSFSHSGRTLSLLKGSRTQENYSVIIKKQLWLPPRKRNGQTPTSRSTTPRAPSPRPRNQAKPFS